MKTIIKRKHGVWIENEYYKCDDEVEMSQLQAERLARLGYVEILGEVNVDEDVGDGDGAACAGVGNSEELTKEALMKMKVEEINAIIDENGLEVNREQKKELLVDEFLAKLAGEGADAGDGDDDAGDGAGSDDGGGEKLDGDE